MVVAKGKKHISKAEIEARRAQEIQVPFKEIKPPKYLNAKQKKTFKELAGKLLAIRIYTELDADALARYIIAQDLYISYTQAINELIEKGNYTDESWSAFQAALEEARTIAADPNATQAQVDDIVVRLSRAMTGLTEKDFVYFITIGEEIRKKPQWKREKEEENPTPVRTGHRRKR